MLKFKGFILGFLLSAIIPGCIVYHPHTTDIPLIRKKNDLRIDAGVSLIPTAHSTISYGLTEKLAIQGFGSVGSDERYYFQAATGLYSKKGNSRVLELYGGVGYGYGDAFDFSDPGHLFGDYQLYYGQLNYGKISNKQSNVEMGFGLKTGYLHSNLTDDNYYGQTWDSGPYKTYHDDCLLLEPSAIIKFGGNRLKFNVKFGGTMIHKFTNKDKQFPYSAYNIGFGLSYSL